MIKSLNTYIIEYFKLYFHRIINLLLITLIILIILRLKVIKNKRKKSIIGEYVLFVSVNIILVMTLYGRKIDLNNVNINLIPLTSYGKVFRDRNPEVLLQIIMNIALFIPFGISLPCNFKWFEKKKRTVGVAFLLSGSIEFIQGITGMGLFELDDIFNNVVGAAIGAMIYVGIKKLKYKLCNKK